MSFANTYQNTRPPTSDPCEKCPKAEDCDQICIQRARWWDAQMEKIRRKLEHET